MAFSLRAVLPATSSLAGFTQLPVCSSPHCPRPPSLWQRWWARNEGIWLEERWYCSRECFHSALLRELLQISLAPPRPRRAPNRVPLGLVLLSRAEITSRQLREALAMQKSAKSGKIGEWLVRMGAVAEEQVTSALARQQACPLFSSCEPAAVPAALRWAEGLVRRYRALPVFYNEGRDSLYVGFLDQLDHGFLYAVERMLRCRAEPCIVPLACYRRALDWLSFEAGPQTIEMRQRQSAAGIAEMVENYAQQIRAEDCGMSVCDRDLWIRLQPHQSMPVDFLMPLPSAS